MRYLLRAGAILLLLAATSCQTRPSDPAETGADRPPQALVGAAARVITPDLAAAGQPVYVGGLARGLEATGVHDDLYARALVITDAEGASVGLVVLDLIGFFQDDVDRVRAELSQRHPDIRLDYLAIASTHTHAGPDVIGLWTPIGGSVDDAYVTHVRGEAVEAVAEAWRNRQAAVMYVGVGEAPGLSKDTRLPELIDDTVLAMGFRSPETGEGIASLVNWNSHPSVTGKTNSELSADYPASLVASMEREWGGISLFATGALGGQIGSGRVKIPDPVTGEVTEVRMRRMELIGEAVADIALSALSEAASREPDRVSLSVRHNIIYPALDNPRFTTGLSIGLIRPRKLYDRQGSGPGQFPSQLEDPSSLRPGVYALKSEVAVVDMGPARWVLIPGELYPELSLGAIQEPQDPGADYQGADHEPSLRPASEVPLFLIGLANDELGYIIPKSQWDLEPPFAYGEPEAQYGEMNSLGPETAPLLLGALREILSEP